MMNVPFLELSKIPHIHKPIPCVACEFWTLDKETENLRFKEVTQQHSFTSGDPFYHSSDLDAIWEFNSVWGNELGSCIRDQKSSFKAHIRWVLNF
jgi:hypothetical protein